MSEGALRARKSMVNEQPRIARYFPTSVQKEVARNAGNIETQRDIMINHAQNTHPGLVNLFNDNYYKEIDAFIEYIQDKYPRESGTAQDKKMGLRPKKTAVKKRRTIRSKTKDGLAYSRTAPKRFESKTLAVGIIRNGVNKGKSIQQITDDYNKVAVAKGWATRTKSSIQTLKSREKIKKQKV